MRVQPAAVQDSSGPVKVSFQINLVTLQLSLGEGGGVVVRLQPSSRPVAVLFSVEEELRAPQQIMENKRKYHKWSEADKVMALEAAAKQGQGGRAVAVRNLQLNFPNRFGKLSEKLVRDWEKAACTGQVGSGDAGQAGGVRSRAGRPDLVPPDLVELICVAIEGQIKAGKQAYIHGIS